MRISDWSSDVCSSDLIEDSATPSFPSANAGYKASDAGRRISRPSLRFHKPANAKAYRGIVFIIMHRFGFVGFLAGAFARQAHRHAITEIHVQHIPPFGKVIAVQYCGRVPEERSEEPTSDLQSLMGITY